jgi:hypothetical protein
MQGCHKIDFLAINIDFRRPLLTDDTQISRAEGLAQQCFEPIDTRSDAADALWLFEWHRHSPHLLEICRSRGKGV